MTVWDKMTSCTTRTREPESLHQEKTSGMLQCCGPCCVQCPDKALEFSVPELFKPKIDLSALSRKVDKLKPSPNEPFCRLLSNIWQNGIMSHSLIPFNVFNIPQSLDEERIWRMLTRRCRVQLLKKHSNPVRETIRFSVRTPASHYLWVYYYWLLLK